MKRSERIRSLLRSKSGGLTTRQVSELTGIDQANVTHVLKAMPDVFIKGFTGSRSVTVWACVAPPPNAMRPVK